MNVIAAVPNYNMKDNIGTLLASLRAQEFDRVYLLDDASTDASADYVKAEFPDVTVVRGQKNVGPGGNRNRILPFLSGGSEIILFMDADVELMSVGILKVVDSWFSDPQVGLVGGLILSKLRQPMFWNYGAAMNPLRDVRVAVYNEIAKVVSPDSSVMCRLRELALEHKDTYNFEIQYAQPVKRKVDWVAEGLFAIRAQVFKRIGGFDARFRYHGDQDLGVRVGEAGFKVLFDPEICVRHLELDVRGPARDHEFRDGLFTYYAKHWGVSRKVFDRLYPK